MIKYLPLILFAICIDAFQAILSWALFGMGMALTAVTPLGGAAIGCAAGYTQATSNGIVNCIRGGVALAFGSFASGPLGIALGMAADVCISFTFGTFLVLTLLYLGMYYPGRIGGGAVFEIIPGLDIFPGWTAMTIACILRKNKESGGTLSGVSKVSSLKNTFSSTTPKPVVQGMLSSRKVSSVPRAASSVSTARQTTKANLKNISGVSKRSVSTPFSTATITANDTISMKQRYAA